jgi:NAD+ synthase (glutamine-hydrolysing)
MSSTPERRTRTLRLALAQINPTVGDIDGNAALAAQWIGRARESEADIVVLPELAITGYPPEDLLLKRHFVEAAIGAVYELARRVEGIVALVGGLDRDPALHNALYVLADGGVEAIYRKMLLPNYGVFDERRYFEPGQGAEILELGGALVAPTICEDIWLPGPPTSLAALAGAELVLNASASPYHRGKGSEREELAAARARENGVAIALCNTVGGQDELVFDGHSLLVDASGETVARGPQFEQDLVLCDLSLPLGLPTGAEPERAPVVARIEIPERKQRRSVQPPLADQLIDADEVYAALTLGVSDYVGKNGFGDVVLGLSGGIDSALVAMVAADAVGPERVRCVIMPSPHSSPDTQEDAAAIAANLGCEAIELRIAPIMEAFDRALAEPFSGTEPGIAEENLQARIRGTLVMALSNKFGWLPLTTGNKSEMSVGYTTLYGDMAGGFAVIKDVPKILVYELVRHRNESADRELVPASVIVRPPTAELRPDQLDSDSLPPYEILDRALEEYVERDGSVESIVAAGVDERVARRVVGLVDRAEYKRRQAPPGIKITPKAFGRDRRLPITNRFGR